MGSEEEKVLSLRHDLWSSLDKVSPQKNDDLMRSFTAEELDFVLKDTKSGLMGSQYCFTSSGCC
jgi:hypothetical protein